MHHYELEEVLDLQESELDTLSKVELVYYFMKAVEEIGSKKTQIKELQERIKVLTGALKSISECSSPGCYAQAKTAITALGKVL